MGLFDALQFDPTTYQSRKGGLLSRLQALIAQQSQYNPAVIRLSAAGSGRGDPANAQPAQAVPGAPMHRLRRRCQPLPAPEQQSFLSGLGDRLSAGLQDLVGNCQKAARSRRSSTAQWVWRPVKIQPPCKTRPRALVAKGLDPSIAQQVVKTPA